MDLQSSTESLLLSSLQLDSRENTPESVSTAALIDDGYGNSTGSLLNNNLQELLNRLNVPDTSYEESEPGDSTMLSPTINEYELQNTSAEENFRNVPGALPGSDDPILLILYNKIQVFLLRNQLSLEFLKIFKKYIRHLVEDGINFFEDRYFLTLQNELSESYDFTPAMEEILNVFLVRPENMILKLTLFEHKRTHRLLSRALGTWRWLFEMQASLSKLEHVWHEFLARKYLLFWLRKFQIVTTDVVAQAKDFYQFTLKSSTFDKWLTRGESGDAKKGLADHYFVDHFLQRLVRRMERLRKEEHSAEIRYNERLQVKTLSLWRLKLRERKFSTGEKNLKETILAKLSSRLLGYQELQKRADFSRIIFQISPFFNHWRLYYIERENRLASLRTIERKFVRKRTFGILKLALDRRNQEHLVKNQLDDILLRFFLKTIWETRFYERVHLYSFSKIGNERLAIKFIQIWKALFFSRMKADNYRKSHLLARFFQDWRLQTKCQQRKSSNAENRLKCIFTQWHDYFETKRALNLVQQDILVKKNYRKWRAKCEAVQKSNQRGVEFHKSSTAGHFFHGWLARHRMISEMEELSLILRKLHAITIFKQGVAHMGEVHRLAEVCDLGVVSKGTLKRFFVAWRKLATEQWISRLELFGDEFEEELKKKSQRSHLRLWVRRLYLYQSDCTARADEIHAKNLQKKYLAVADKRVKSIQTFSFFADELRNKTLSMNCLFLWKERYDNVNNLHIKLETESDKKNLALLLGYLNVWSMRMLKSRRNDETVQIFRMRWDRAAVRGLMLLWKNRSDNSPKKLRAARLEEQASQGMELVTPVRRNLPRKNTIPGSEGVKQYRIEAMKSHYGRVRRAIPSPVKSSRTLNSMAKQKIESERGAAAPNQKILFPSKLSLERINKNLASKIDTINFERIPEVRLDPFVEAGLHSGPRVDTSLLEDEDDVEYDESPIRRM